MSEARLKLVNVSKSWGSLAALRDINLTVNAGDFVSLLGPSGCGKTTLLRLITGHLGVDSGQIVLDGRDITNQPTYRRNMGMVFQNFALFPHLSVADNVGFALDVRRTPAKERQNRVDEALAMVHLSDYRDSYPRQMSGGQQQRVGLARAIVYRPTILLMDEPLSNLDASLREEMRIEISEVTRRLGITTIYVTHDQREALALSDAIALMNKGRVVQFGTPEEVYRTPANAFAASFVGYGNALPVELSAGKARIAGNAGTIATAAAEGRSGEAKAFIMAGDVSLSKETTAADNQVTCKVTERAFMGDHIEYVVEHESGLRLHAHMPVGLEIFERGEEVGARISPAKVVIVQD